MTAPTLTKLCSGPGPEDLDLVDWQGHTTLLTATYSRALFPKVPHPRPRVGTLEVFKPQEARFEPVPISPAPPPGFKPVGLSVVRQSLAPGLGGKQLVYVTNAYQGPGLLAKGGSVELFEVEDSGTMKYLGPLGGGKCELLHKVNGIVASRDGTVYVSTFGTFPAGREKVNVLELNSKGRDKCSINAIVCFTPRQDLAQEGTWHVVATGIAGPNGLALSPGETILYCNAYHSRQIHAFQRGDEPGGPLIKQHEIKQAPLPFHPDNLKCLPTGELWCAGQTSSLPTFLHLLSGARLPSRGGVAKLHWDPHHTQLIRDAEWVDQIAGDAHAPSVALPLGDALYLGHIMEAGVTEVKPGLHKSKEPPATASASQHRE